MLGLPAARSLARAIAMYALFSSAVALPSTVVSTPNANPETSTDAATRARLAHQYGKLPLIFEPNRGQADGSVRYLARGPGYKLLLLRDEAAVRLESRRADKSS